VNSNPPGGGQSAQFLADGSYDYRITGISYRVVDSSTRQDTVHVRYEFFP
jgi:hypothetical protein